MPRTFQWARRILSLAVALTAGAFGVLLLASPASAHDASATAQLSCQSDGSVLVTWTIKNDYNLAATVSNMAGQPVTPDAASSQLAPYGSITATQTVDAATTGASISYHVAWTDGYALDKSAQVRVPARQCAASPSPSPSVAPPSPSPSTAAPVSSSPAAGTGGGGGSLPVTGSSLPAIIGVAAALLVGGVVLFVFARRRRTS